MFLQWFAIIFGWSSLVLSVALAIFRIYRYATLPLNLRWEVYPVPHETKEKRRYGGSYMEGVDWAKKPRSSSFPAELQEMASEIFTLKKVREHNPYGLWPWSISLHWGVYLLLTWAVLLAGAALVPGLTFLSQVIGPLSFLLGIIGAVGLILKRVTVPALRLYTEPVDIFNLVFLALIFGLGLASWLVDPLFAGHQTYLGSVLAFRPTPVPAPVLTMFLTLQLFAIYMPLSRMIHPLLKHFTFREVLWDDGIKVKGSRVEERLSHQLDYPFTWAGPHMAGAETWLEGVQSTSQGGEEK